MKEIPLRGWDSSGAGAEGAEVKEKARPIRPFHHRQRMQRAVVVQFNMVA